MKKTTGQRLRDIRGTHTQAEIAELLGISRKTWIRYENDERDPDVEMIVKLNMLFGIQPLWLLTGNEDVGAGIRLDPAEAKILIGYRKCNAQGKQAIASMVSSLQAGARPEVDGQGDRSPLVSIAGNNSGVVQSTTETITNAAPLIVRKGRSK